MDMSEAKIYFPKSQLKEVKFNDGGSILKIGLHAETAIAFIKEHANDRGFINLVVSQRKEPGRFGDTHSLTLDTWKPDLTKAREAAKQTESSPKQKPEDDDCPF